MDGQVWASSEFFLRLILALRSRAGLLWVPEPKPCWEECCAGVKGPRAAALLGGEVGRISLKLGQKEHCVSLLLCLPN